MVTFSPQKANAGEAERAVMIRLLDEAPGLASYPGRNVVVLSRQLKVRLLSDGSLERRARWVVRYRGVFPRNWENWTVAAPKGGSAEITRAELYSSGKVKFIKGLDVTESTEGGGKGASVRIPESADESLLYLETVQRFPRRFDFSDHVWVALDLPQWEVQVAVDVPHGTEFFWAGNGVGQPEKSQQGGVDRYAWNAKNLPAWEGFSILDGGRSSLGFSLKSGLLPSLESLKETEKLAEMPLPEKLVSGKGGKDSEKSGMRLIETLNEETARNGRLPESWTRPFGDASLAEGPWTGWEATLIAAGGLKGLGWNVTTWWLPSVPVSEKIPAGETLWSFPVLELTAPGGKPFIFVRGFPPGKVPSSLVGVTLYRLKDGKLLSKRIPEGSPSGNRLSVKWDLALDELGSAEGKMTLFVRGGWNYLLSRGEGSTKENAADLARAMLASTPFLGGMGAPEVSESAAGLRVAVPVKGLLGIATNRDVLVSFPASMLPGIYEIMENGEGASLRFPFSIQQEFLLHLPAGYRVLESPALRGRMNAKATVDESFRSKENKGVVEGSQLLTVTASRLDETVFPALKESLLQVMRWGKISIPLRKR